MKGLVAVAGCHVIACTREGTDVWVEPAREWGAIRAEWLVCQNHFVQLDHGAAFSARMDGVKKVLLVIDDQSPERAG